MNAPMSADRKKQIARESAKILLDTRAVLFNAKEPFQYTSGNCGPVYVDCRRLVSFVGERETLMNFAVEILSEEIGAENLDCIAGGETAGIPYAAFIAQQMEKPMLYIRKKPKGFGRMSQIEGHFEQSENPEVILVEDVQNYGGSKQIFVDALREAGAIISNFFVIFDYGIRPEVAGLNKDMGLTAHHLCNWHDVLNVAREEKYFDTDTLASVEAFLNDPEGWAPRPC